MNVAICDSSPRRHAAMDGAFASLDHVTVVSTGVIRDCAVFICLVHDNEYDGERAFSLNASHYVWYGATRGVKRLCRPGDDNIYRLIDAEEGHPAPGEARDIVEYFLSLDRGNGPSKPAILLPPRRLDLLVALQVLCEGFMAAEAVRMAGEQDLGDEGTTEVLSRMGFDESGRTALAREQPDTFRALKSNLSRVRCAEWWEVLGDDWREKLREHWVAAGTPVPIAVERLLIQQAPKMHVVAEAHRALAQEVANAVS